MNGYHIKQVNGFITPQQMAIILQIFVFTMNTSNMVILNPYEKIGKNIKFRKDCLILNRQLN